MVALKARVGGIQPNESGVPFFKRYFLGGSTTLRGWGRFEVSPLANGEVIGGLGYFDSSVELRFPIRGKFSGVVFGDGGQVTETAWDDNMFHLRTDVGLGLRYLTPIGPLRIDVGYQLNPVPGSAHRRRRAGAPLAHPLQRRAGVLAVHFVPGCRMIER